MCIYSTQKIPKNIELCNGISAATNQYVHSGHQVVTKNVAKCEFVLGIASLMVKTLGSENINQVQTLVAELIEDLEIMKALLLASESEAALDSWGVMCPSRVPITVARNQFIRMYPRMIEIIQLLGSSSLMALPTESDLNGPLSDYVNRYMDTDNSSAKERIELFRLAWDLSCSAFGSRQVLYERYFQGDWMRNASVLFGSYSTDKFVEQVKEFLRTD